MDGPGSNDGCVRLSSSGLASSVSPEPWTCIVSTMSQKFFNPGISQALQLSTFGSLEFCTTLYFYRFYSTFSFLGCIQVMFCPLSEKILNFTYRIHAYCKRVNAEMLKKKVKDFLSPISTVMYTAPIFYVSANIHLHIQMYMNTLGTILHK